MNYPYWSALEVEPTLADLEPMWRHHLNGAYVPFRNAVLNSHTEHVDSFPCPHHCGCRHAVCYHPDHRITAVCRCRQPYCPDLELTPDQLLVWKVNWDKLGHALCSALGIDRRYGEINLRRTVQIGSHPSEGIPVFLTIHQQAHYLQHDIAELCARLEKPFILLGPTHKLVTATCTDLLNHWGATYFALSSHIRLTETGTLVCDPAPDQLFADFLSSRHPRHSTLDRFGPSTLDPRHSTPPRYSIRKGLGVWYLTFDGMDVVIKHERGMFYVAYLLLHPPEHPIHAIDLMGKIVDIYRNQLALPQIVDSTTGKTMILESHARIQERSLSLDDRETLRNLYRKQKELEAILEDELTSEPEKAEALRDLEAITDFLHHHASRSKDGAQRAARSVRQSITRLHGKLASALGENGAPHSVLRQFADHVQKYLITPSARYSAFGASGPRGPLAGCFTYGPPPGVIWGPR